MSIKFCRYWSVLSFLELFVEVNSSLRSPYLHSFEDGVFEVQWGALYLSVNRVKIGKASCVGA